MIVGRRTLAPLERELLEHIKATSKIWDKAEVKKLKGKITDMVILNETDDMLAEAIFQKKVADMRGEE